MFEAKLSHLVLVVAAAMFWNGCGTGTQPPVPADDAEQPPPEDPEPTGDPTATFLVTFTGTWTASGHPGNIPSGAHFSPPVGAVHGTLDIVWAGGGSIASAGIESMAETGGTSVVRGEIAGFIADGHARSEIVATGVGATGSTTVSVTASELHRYLSLTSMIAPSPDWFLGVRNVDLRPGGVWIDRLEIDLDTVYDAGTDGGAGFLSADSDVTPHEPIHLVADDGIHFLGTPLALATLVIERVLN